MQRVDFLALSSACYSLYDNVSTVTRTEMTADAERVHVVMCHLNRASCGIELAFYAYAS